MIKDATAYMSVSPVTGVYRYRRDIPVALRAGIGKRHYRVSLKTKDYRQAVIKASLLAVEHDRLFAKLKPSVADLKRLRSPQQDYKDAIGWLKSNGYGPDFPPDMSDEVWEERMMHASFIEEQQEADAGQGKPPTPFNSLIRDGLRGDLGKPPTPSFSEATAYYLKEKNEKNRRREPDYKLKFARETNRYADDLLASMGEDKALDKIMRADGKDFVSYLEKKGLSPATVNKGLRTVNTILNYVNTEQELELVNRLKGMTVEDAIDEEDKRRSFTKKEMNAYLLAADSSKDEIRLLIHLTSYTGTRHKELRGLRVDDFQLNAAVPHIRLRPYADRKLKTTNSRRCVPLVAGGLRAASEAIAIATADGRGNPESLVFKDYQGVNGGNALSAILSKIIRERMKIADKLLTPYSTRHTMEDLLRAVETPRDISAAILGHGDKSDIAAAYGDGYDLSLLAKYMTLAVERLEA